jgi:serine/threonine-protein kinase HipA
VGFAAANVETMIDELTSRTDAVIDEVSAQLPEGFPMDVADAVFGGMRRLNRKLGQFT